MAMLAPFYDVIKVLHILAFTAWMAGMLYLPRLFVYHHQAADGGEAAGLITTMERKLLKLIMTPAMLATWLFGLLLVGIAPEWANDGWFIIKLLAVLAMTGLHGFFSKNRRAFAEGARPLTEKFWRMMNEVPFVFLAIIVAMVILKPLVR